MWTNIIGGLFIVSGAAFLVNPDRLRKKLQRKGVRTLRRYLVAAAFAAGILLISAAWKQEGMLPKIMIAAGIVFLLKGLYFVKAKSADVIAGRVMKLPALWLRLFALGQVALGVLIIVMRMRG